MVGEFFNFFFIYLLQEQVEALVGEYPWDAAANGRTVVYCAGAWAFLHPSHQNLLWQARQRGDHVCVGIHDSITRTKNYARSPEENHEVRVERVRTQKGIHSIVKHAPWKIDETFMKRMGIAKVFIFNDPMIVVVHDCTQE